MTGRLLLVSVVIVFVLSAVTGHAVRRTLAPASVPDETLDTFDKHDHAPVPVTASPVMPAPIAEATMPTVGTRTLPTDPLPTTDFARNRAAIEALARAGRADAARHLGQVLTTCRFHIAKSPEVFERELVKSAASRPTSASTEEQADMIAHRVEQMRQMQALCDGVTEFGEEDEAMGYEWMIRAANLGDPIAMALRYDSEWRKVGFSTGGRIDAADEMLALEPVAAGMLAQAAATGEPVALRRLARAHASGVLATHDPVRARAYELAALGAERRPGYAPRDPRAHAEGLDAAQQREAQRVADEILAACCRTP